MVATPIIYTPYHRLAFDIVGPLQRTESVYGHVLTAIYMGTRYPYCIPLKRIDAISVAEGLMDILSHTGIPHEVRTDQGSVFMGRLCSEQCKLLRVRHIKTTALHPQSNGVLERWHGCLKGMLRKMEDRLEPRDKLLKYCLLAYRATPHAATGYSPFQLVNGRPLRGPLEAMKDSLISCELHFSGAVEWVNQLGKTLTDLLQVACSREAKYKAKVKSNYDKKAEIREYKPGEMVLLHTPNLTGKLELVWYGPYEVTKQLEETTYHLAVPERRNHKIVAHANGLKPWKDLSVNLFRDVVAQECVDSNHPVGRTVLGETEISEKQRYPRIRD